MDFEFGKDFLDSGFANMERKAAVVTTIMQNYRFEDLVIAIYAITSWRDNRSAQESCLALNRALIQCDRFGNKDINSYEDLSVFFDKIESSLQATHMDDSVINDFGEVQLCFNEKFYPIITGTGHTGSVYAALQYLENLSIEMDCNTESEAVLAYTKTMIDSLKDTNISKREQPAIVFEIPTEEHFIVTKRYVNAEPTTMLARNTVQKFLATKQPIVKTHFILKGQKSYPLFNPSFTLDYYTELLNSATPQNIVSHIHSTIFKRIDAIHLSSSEIIGDLLLYKPKIAV